MLMILIIMALAVNGGLYVGTIAFSAYQSAQFDKAVTVFQKAGLVTLA